MRVCAREDGGYEAARCLGTKKHGSHLTGGIALKARYNNGDHRVSKSFLHHLRMDASAQRD